MWLSGLRSTNLFFIDYSFFQESSHKCGSFLFHISAILISRRYIKMQSILFTVLNGKYIYWNDSVATATMRLFSNQNDKVLHDLVLFWLLVFLTTKEIC